MRHFARKERKHMEYAVKSRLQSNCEELAGATQNRVLSNDAPKTQEYACEALYLHH